MGNEEMTDELLVATSSRNIRKVDYLMQCGIDPSTPSKDGICPIHTASLLESPSGPLIVHTMLNYGADPNAKTPDGLSPLHIASMWGRVDTVNILLDYGANVTEKDLDDKSALDYAEEADSLKDECIDALTRYRPSIKSKNKDFKTKSRTNLTKIIGKNEFDTSLNTSFNDTKEYSPGNGSVNNIKRSTKESSKKVVTSVSLLNTKNERSILKSIQASPIVKTSLSKFYNRNMKKQSSTPKNIFDRISHHLQKTNKVLNFDETLYQTCYEYFDQSMQETQKDITNIVSSTLLDGIQITSEEIEKDECTFDVYDESHNDCSSDKENNDTFWSVLASPQLNPDLKGSPITVRRKIESSKVFETPKKSMPAQMNTGKKNSPLFVPKNNLGNIQREMITNILTDTSSTSDDNNSLNNFLLNADNIVPPKQKKETSKLCCKCQSLATNHNTTLNSAAPTPLSRGKGESVMIDNLSSFSINESNKKSLQHKNNVTPDKANCVDLTHTPHTNNINLQTEETIDYSNSSVQDRSAISQLIQYYEGHNEAEVENGDCNSTLDNTNKSYIEIEGLNVSGKLVKKYVSFFDCTKKDLDDAEVAKKRRESMKEYLNISILYDWKDVSQSNSTFESSVIIPPHIVSLTNFELREKLMKHGETPGPISSVTRCLYQRRLTHLEKYPDVIKKGEEKYKNYPYELRQVLLGTSTISKEIFEELESEMTSIFANPSKHTWREGTNKTSFNYLLLDPRVTRNLPSRSGNLTIAEQLSIFTAAVFYIGKGKNSRPYEHFHEAAKYEKCNKGKPCSNKVNVIRDIWNAGYGVVSVHVFHSIIPVEAYTREACMLEAMSLSRLTNLKRGEFYGPASSWTVKKKRLLGVNLLMKSLKIYLIDGERQIRQKDVTKR